MRPPANQTNRLSPLLAGLEAILGGLLPCWKRLPVARRGKVNWMMLSNRRSMGRCIGMDHRWNKTTKAIPC